MASKQNLSIGSLKNSTVTRTGSTALIPLARPEISNYNAGTTMASSARMIHNFHVTNATSDNESLPGANKQSHADDSNRVSGFDVMPDNHTEELHSTTS